MNAQYFGRNPSGPNAPLYDLLDGSQKLFNLPPRVQLAPAQYDTLAVIPTPSSPGALIGGVPLQFELNKNFPVTGSLVLHMTWAAVTGATATTIHPRVSSGWPILYLVEIRYIIKGKRLLVYTPDMLMLMLFLKKRSVSDSSEYFSYYDLQKAPEVRRLLAAAARETFVTLPSPWADALENSAPIGFTDAKCIVEILPAPGNDVYESDTTMTFTAPTVIELLQEIHVPSSKEYSEVKAKVDGSGYAKLFMPFVTQIGDLLASTASFENNIQLNNFTRPAAMMIFFIRLTSDVSNNGTRVATRNPFEAYQRMTSIALRAAQQQVNQFTWTHKYMEFLIHKYFPADLGRNIYIIPMSYYPEVAHVQSSFIDMLQAKPTYLRPTTPSTWSSSVGALHVFVAEYNIYNVTKADIELKMGQPS